MHVNSATMKLRILLLITIIEKKMNRKLIFKVVTLFSTITIVYQLECMQLLQTAFDKYADTYGTENLSPENEQIARSVIKECGIDSSHIRLRQQNVNTLNSRMEAVTVFNTILFNEKAFNKHTEIEKRATIAHELGHIKYKDSLRHLCQYIAINAIFFGCYLWLFKNKKDFTIPNISAKLSAAYLALLFRNITISYIRKQDEFNADKFAARFNYSIGLISSFIKGRLVAIRNKNIIISEPDLVKRINQLTGSHPSVDDRVQQLKDLANIDSESIELLKTQLSRELDNNENLTQQKFEKHEPQLDALISELKLEPCQMKDVFIGLFNQNPALVYFGTKFYNPDIIYIDPDWLGQLSTEEKRFILGRRLLIHDLDLDNEFKNKNIEKFLNITNKITKLAKFLSLSYFALKADIRYLPNTVLQLATIKIVEYLRNNSEETLNVKTKILTDEAVAKKLNCLDGAIGALTKIKNNVLAKQTNDQYYKNLLNYLINSIENLNVAKTKRIALQ